MSARNDNGASKAIDIYVRYDCFGWVASCPVLQQANAELCHAAGSRQAAQRLLEAHELGHWDLRKIRRGLYQARAR